MLKRDRFGNYINVVSDYPRAPLPIAAQRNIPSPYTRMTWAPNRNIANLPAVETGDSSASSRGVLPQRRLYTQPTLGRGRYTGSYENVPAPYTRPRSWDTETPIGRLPSSAERGVLAQVAAQVGRGRPGLIRMLLNRR